MKLIALMTVAALGVVVMVIVIIKNIRAESHQVLIGETSSVGVSKKKHW